MEDKGAPPGMIETQLGGGPVTWDRRVLRSIASDPAVMTLNARAWLALALLASVMCALIFGTAGTVRFWQAWVYVSIFVGGSVLTTLYLIKKEPALLGRRGRGGAPVQRVGRG